MSIKKIIFLCHGNICRSPVAEAVMKSEVKKLGLADKFEISSAALSSDEIGNTPDSRSLKTLENIAIADIVRNHKARKISSNEFDNFDLFVVMDENNRRQFKALFGSEDKMIKLLGNEDVADPYYSLDFDKALSDIQNGVKILINRLSKDLY